MSSIQPSGKPSSGLQALRNMFLGFLAFTAFVLIAAFLLAQPVHAQAGKGELRIGIQKSSAMHTLQRANGSLEKKLQPLGLTVKWV